MTVREYLENEPLLFDGAMGTYIIEKYPKYAKEQLERLNLTEPGLIQQIHEEYLQAGAVAIKTNTFSANCQTLQTDRKQLEQMIQKGWALANAAVQKYDDTRFVFADIGPAVTEGEEFLFYKEMVDIFLQCGAKNFLFETQENRAGLEQICSYIKEKEADSFLIVSFAASPEGYTRAGFLAEKLFWQMQQSDSVDAVGFNCISGPKHLLERTKRLPAHRMKKYLTVMPNAGYPAMLGKRIYYGKNQNYYGKSLIELLEAGASVIGGCCGTTPSDIAEAGKLLAHSAFSYQTLLEDRRKAQREYIRKASAQETGNGEIRGMQNSQNTFAQKLQAGKKVVVVELDPPVEPDIDFFMEGAARYQHAGVDAIDIADCPIARARIDSSLLACKLKRELGMTAIPHITCRDRNINATKALLLGLNIEGVNNVLTVTGDPVPEAMRHEVKTVFSYNSAVLSRHIQTFNEEIFARNPFMVSGALNINAVNFDSQIAHARKKIENGVSVLFTQPVLSERGLENLKRARAELPIKLLGGIMPVVSYRNAAFMNHEMAGIEVQDEIIRLYEGKNREEGEELAFVISQNIIDEMSQFIDGFYVITPFKRIELVLKIVNYIKNRYVDGKM